MTTDRAVKSQHKTRSWAEQLAAHRLASTGAQGQGTDSRVIDAINALWQLFDDATREANEALTTVGSADQIAVARRDHERAYAMMGPDGMHREIRVSLTLNINHHQCYGGASVSISRTRASIGLEPVTTGSPHWRVLAAGVAFTPEIVHDLFLSIFADDPLATQRLSPLSGRDLFDGPWS